VSVEVYSLTYADVEREIGRSFTASGRPSQTQVASMIESAAARVNGRLVKLCNTTTTAIAASEQATSWAKEAILLEVQKRLFRQFWGVDELERSREIRLELTELWRDFEPAELDVYSATAGAGSVQLHDPVDYADDAEVDFAFSDRETAF